MVNLYRQLAFIIFLSLGMTSSGMAAALSTQKALQKIVEKAVYLNDLCVESQKIIAVLADPRSGQIVAIASRSKGKPASPMNAHEEANSFNYNPGATINVFSKQTRLIAGLENSVTPMQMVIAYSAIANGGILLKPSFGSASRNRAPSGVRILSRREALALQDSLRKKVMGSDTLFLARVKGMNLAGSAGHARQNRWLGLSSSTTASFIGLFPAKHPEYVCLVVVQDAHVLPRYNLGSLVAAPCFSEIAAKSKRYLKETD